MECSITCQKRGYDRKKNKKEGIKSKEIGKKEKKIFNHSYTENVPFFPLLVEMLQKHLLPNIVCSFTWVPMFLNVCRHEANFDFKEAVREILQKS